MLGSAAVPYVESSLPLFGLLMGVQSSICGCTDLFCSRKSPLVYDQKQIQQSLPLFDTVSQLTAAGWSRSLLYPPTPEDRE